MKVLVTGSNGFIGKNLLEKLAHLNAIEILTFSREDDIIILDRLVASSDFIFHLAGVNRPENNKEFYSTNRDLTSYLVESAKKTGRTIPILLTSSLQATVNDSDYAKSKYEGEIVLKEYSRKTDSSVYIYRLPNIFGKWSKPNYNTVIATWCYNITRDLPIIVNNDDTKLLLVYIDDVVNQFIKHLDENYLGKITYLEVFPLYTKSLGEIKKLLKNFKSSRKSLLIPSVGKGFERALYATYLSFLPFNKFSYKLKGYEDERGTFYEFIKTLDSGQFSISTTKPGVTRGNHYHNTKNEKFLVIKGEASIKHRQIHGDEVIEYKVSDKKMEVVEMIPGYTHDITNIGNIEMVLLLWANEVFDKENPDTFFLKVENNGA